MIQTIVTHPCPQCGSENIVKNGPDYKDSQRNIIATNASVTAHCTHVGGMTNKLAPKSSAQY